MKYLEASLTKDVSTYIYDWIIVDSFAERAHVVYDICFAIFSEVIFFLSLFHFDD